MESDTTDYTSSTAVSGRKKPKKRNFLKCWGKDAADESDNEAPAPSRPQPKKNLTEKATMTEDAQQDTQQQGDVPAQGTQSDERQSDDQQSKESKNGKQSARCPKCLKRKRDRSSSGRRMDKRFCTCRRSGYCNTNTIIFPNDFKRGSIEAKEIHYLQLIKDIIKDETKKGVDHASDFTREIDRQREEIKDLKSLLLNNLLANKISDRKDMARGSSASDSRQTTPRKSEVQARNDNRPREAPKDNNDGTSEANPNDKEVKSETDEKRGFWNKMFRKKK